MARRRHWERVAQVKVRLPESIRWSLEREASQRGHSMNEEIVRRLRESLLMHDKTTSVIARALLNGLDDAIVNEMMDIVSRQIAGDMMVNYQNERIAEQNERIAEDMMANDQIDEMHEREADERSK